MRTEMNTETDTLTICWQKHTQTEQSQKNTHTGIQRHDLQHSCMDICKYLNIIMFSHYKREEEEGLNEQI